MLDGRARIGYLCPSVFEMIAYDFYRIVPPGVGLIGVHLYTWSGATTCEERLC
jgi:hypothetical protein